MAFAILLALAVAVFVLYTIVERVLNPTTQTTASSIYGGVSGTVATLITTSTTPVTTAGANTGTTVAGANTGTTFDTNTPTSSGLGGSVLVRPHAATASSSLDPTSIGDFRPTNLLDGDLSTVWTEGATGGGVDEWVRLDFDEPITLARIEIANGNQKDKERFAGDERVRTLEIQYSDSTTQIVQLLDAEGLQLISPATKETQWIKLTILSVYPKYTWDQAALSEVRVYETIQ
jgi:hypothetical protein